MKALKMMTYWTAEEADCIYTFLDELKAVIWGDYGDDIEKMYKLMAAEELDRKNDMEDKVPDEIPF